MENWKTLSSKKVLEYGKWLVVEEHTVQLPNGNTIKNWPWIITPDYVNVAVEDSDGNFICFQQTKYSVKDGTTLATCAGYIEPGEDPLDAAKRELAEEMGYSSDNWLFFGKYAVDGNRGAGTAYLYLARHVTFTGKQVSDDLEEVEIKTLSRAELQEKLLAGEFKMISWATVMSLALQATSGKD